MNTNRFNQLKKENRAGYLICTKCKTNKYFSQQQIQKLNKVICTECSPKIVIKKKPIKKIIKPKYTKKWGTMTQEEKQLALSLIRSGASYQQISETLKIETKELYQTFNREKNKSNITTILKNKISHFSRGNSGPPLFTVSELLSKIGPNPKCYLTNDPIDLSQRETYQLDHIVPRSKGGLNTLDNCGLVTKNANMVKHDLLLDELVIICKKILTNQ